MNRRIVAAALITASLLMSACSMIGKVDEEREETARSAAESVETIETSASAPVTEPSASTSAIASVSETSALESETSASETTDDMMPADEEGVPLVDSDAAAFFASTADTYLMSSGAGGWGAYMVVNSDGTFDYNYHDSDYDMFYICHAQGRLGNVIKVDEFTYKVEIVEITFEYDVDSVWSVTEPDGSVINYTAADSYGLHQGDILTYYMGGIESSLLPEGYLFWYLAPRALGPEDVPDPFPLSGYYNAVEEAAYIEDDYE